MLAVAATEARHRGREHPAAGGEERRGGGRADHGLAQRPRDQRGHDRARHRRGGGRDDRMVARAVTRLAPDRPLTLVQQTTQPAPAFHPLVPHLTLSTVAIFLQILAFSFLLISTMIFFHQLSSYPYSFPRVVYTMLKVCTTFDHIMLPLLLSLPPLISCLEFNFLSLLYF